MQHSKFWKLFATTCLLVMVIGQAPVAIADHHEQEADSEDEEPTVDVSAIVDAITQLADDFSDFASGGLADVLKQVLIAVLIKPFQALANLLVDLLTRVMTSYPDVTMKEVRDLHRAVFQVTLLLAAPAFTVIGYIYLTGSLFSISYEQVHKLIPRLITAIGFGAVAPWILQYPVRLSELVTVGLKPVDPGFWVVNQLVSEMIVVAVVNAFLLLGIAVTFIIRDIYLLFACAAAPLIALGWALPYSRRYASPLIGAFWGFLLIGPLDMIIFRLVLALLEVDAYEIPSFLWAAGGLVLMLAVPYVVLKAGASISGVALAATGRAVGKTQRMVAPHVTEPVNDRLSQKYTDYKGRAGRAKNRFLQETVDVGFKERSSGDVEMQPRSTFRNRLNRVKSRIRNDDPADVGVEKHWQKDERGDWQEEAHLKDGDD